jgi:hypothetical protein
MTIRWLVPFPGAALALLLTLVPAVLQAQPLINALVPLQSGWAKVPGGGTTAVAHAVTVFQDRLYLFGIGIKHHKHYLDTFDGTNWSGWRQVPGGGTTVLSDAATVFNDRLYLFGIGVNDRSHYVNTFDGTNWSGWQQVPGGGTTAVADAATVLYNRLYLFGIGIADHKHYVNKFNGTNWSRGQNPERAYSVFGPTALSDGEPRRASAPTDLGETTLPKGADLPPGGFGFTGLTGATVELPG